MKTTTFLLALLPILGVYSAQLAMIPAEGVYAAPLDIGQMEAPIAARDEEHLQARDEEYFEEDDEDEEEDDDHEEDEESIARRGSVLSSQNLKCPCPHKGQFPSKFFTCGPGGPGFKCESIDCSIKRKLNCKK